MRSTVVNCARCGRTHEQVEWRRLERPIVDADEERTTWTHWAPCPTNGDPILMREEPPPEPPTRILALPGEEKRTRSDLMARYEGKLRAWNDEQPRPTH